MNVVLPLNRGRMVMVLAWIAEVHLDGVTCLFLIESLAKQESRTKI
jgi:hypothetical protein